MQPQTAVDTIRTKRDRGTLDAGQIAAFVDGAARGTWPDYQLAALLMAIRINGMASEETALLTRAMADSGKRFDWSRIPGPKVDKHSTGGVGDKTSLILAPLAAACGAIVPMMSGRGLGHTGGTLDKLESIPGFRVNLSEVELEHSLKTIGVALIGQTAEVAPADRKLYALRDVTATVESIPLITASILSKKLAEGIDGLVMDVKFGRGAFMPTFEEAKSLAESIVNVGIANGLRTEALLTAMDNPLGSAVGNSLEAIECIEILKGNGPADVAELSVLLAARMLLLAGLAADEAEALAKVLAARQSGAGLEKFRRIIEMQGGDPKVLDDYSLLPTAPHTLKLNAPTGGYVSALHAGLIGRAAMRLGAGRARVEDRVDPAVGARILKPAGAAITAGEPWLEIHYRRGPIPEPVLRMFADSLEIEPERPVLGPLVREIIR